MKHLKPTINNHLLKDTSEFSDEFKEAQLSALKSGEEVTWFCNLGQDENISAWIIHNEEGRQAIIRAFGRNDLHEKENRTSV